MAEIPQGGMLGNFLQNINGPQNSTPVTPQEQTKLDEKDNVRRDEFLSYLNQQLIGFEKKVHEGRFFDTADFISKGSVYLQPGVFRPD